MDLAISIILLLIAAIIGSVLNIRCGIGPFTPVPFSTWQTRNVVAFVAVILVGMVGFGGLLGHVQTALFGQTSGTGLGWGLRGVSIAAVGGLFAILHVVVFVLLRKMMPRHSHGQV